MAVDKQWIETVKTMAEIKTRPSIDVEFRVEDGKRSVNIAIPVSKGVSREQWQRRVSDDILPDSPNADAPEKTPFEILNKLTDSVKAEHPLSQALADDSEFAPLRPLFVFATKGMAEIPVAFHVLAVKAADRSVRCRSFTHKSFILLMRSKDGTLREDLVRRFIDQFRQPPAELDLAQRTVLERLQPEWSPDRNHDFSFEDPGRVIPFVPAAGELLQRDIETLLDAELTRADFFRYTNQLLALHMGLYQPRLAAHLNPAIELLLQEMADPHSVSSEQVARVERGDDPQHQFTASLDVQVPEGSSWRRMSTRMPAFRSFLTLERRLATLHFNLMLFNRIRSLVSTYLRDCDFDDASAVSLSRKPSDIVQRLQDDPEFRSYLERASEALAVRFIFDQLSDASEKDSFEVLAREPSGLHALRSFYERYNFESSPKPTSSRAHKNGSQVVRRLLGRGEHGLLQARKGFGAYFEIGAGLLPLLLITSIGPGAEKIPVMRFWTELGRYGMRLPSEERERLLGRLKAMGLYERYSDAGEASYVRGLLAVREVA